MRNRHATRLSILGLALLLPACGGEEPAEADGDADSDSDVDADGDTDADTDADADADADADGDADVCVCGPGEVCVQEVCTAACGHPQAEACAAEDVCDFATGRCVAEGTPGILGGEDTRCGAGGPTCRPGTECTLESACQPAPPCRSMECLEDTCWGTECNATRPAPGCVPASLERLNMPDVLLGQSGGAIDLDFDDACNAYVVTFVSGTDFLRVVSPAGELVEHDGVSNLNMGEVAAARRPGGEFGTEGDPGNAALTYICCAACNCQAEDPQGVARLDREGDEALPMVVVAEPSEGEGPFDDSFLDTGPYGLAWGMDNRLYVGNVTGQGDLVRADLDTGDIEEIHLLTGRIHASTSFDATSLLVAIEGGEIQRVHTDLETAVPWGLVEEDVTSLVRDPFTGHVFVVLSSGRIAELDAQGAAIADFQDMGQAVRAAYAPDGHLYVLVPGYPGPASITRFELPATL